MSVIASEYSIIDFYWRRSSLRCYWLFVFYFFIFFDGFGFGFWPVSMVENGRFDWTAAKWRQMTQFSASKMPSVDVVDRNGAEFIRISPKVEPKSNQQTQKKNGMEIGTETERQFRQNWWKSPIFSVLRIAEMKWREIELKLDWKLAAILAMMTNFSAFSIVTEFEQIWAKNCAKNGGELVENEPKFN